MCIFFNYRLLLTMWYYYFVFEFICIYLSFHFQRFTKSHLGNFNPDAVQYIIFDLIQFVYTVCKKQNRGHEVATGMCQLTRIPEMLERVIRGFSSRIL